MAVRQAWRLSARDFARQHIFIWKVWCYDRIWGIVMGNLGLPERAQNLRDMVEQGVDVLVIGGGITGCGVALDAAVRGYRVGLVEQNDFASGTSSKSTKLVHGGIRYLPQYDFTWCGRRWSSAAT